MSSRHFGPGDVARKGARHRRRTGVPAPPPEYPAATPATPFPGSGLGPPPNPMPPPSYGMNDPANRAQAGPMPATPPPFSVPPTPPAGMPPPGPSGVPLALGGAATPMPVGAGTVGYHPNDERQVTYMPPAGPGAPQPAPGPGAPVGGMVPQQFAPQQQQAIAAFLAGRARRQLAK